jgi:hypothetical protein
VTYIPRPVFANTDLIYHPRRDNTGQPIDPVIPRGIAIEILEALCSRGSPIVAFSTEDRSMAYTDPVVINRMLPHYRPIASELNEPLQGAIPIIFRRDWRAEPVQTIIGLTVGYQINVAMNMDYTSQSIHDCNLKGEEDFKTHLRSWCGLFISIHQGSIYFLYETAREFLLADVASPTNVSSELRWHHSITMKDAHDVLAELCVLYLTWCFLQLPDSWVL